MVLIWVAVFCFFSAVSFPDKNEHCERDTGENDLVIQHSDIAASIYHSHHSDRSNTEMTNTCVYACQLPTKLVWKLEPNIYQLIIYD